MNNDQAYIEDILDMIAEIENAVAGLEYKDFAANRTVYRAVERILRSSVKQSKGCPQNLLGHIRKFLGKILPVLEMC